MLTDRALTGLQEATHRDRVLTAREDLLTYASDATPLYRQAPAAIVIPKDAREVGAILALANEERFAVVPRGAGTGLSGGAVPTESSVVLLFPSWNRVQEIDVANGTAWVEPGVVTADLHKAVEAEGLFYPPDPGSMRVCTIGGNVAENAGGLRGLKYGVTKNYVQGLEAVLPTGEWVRLGGKAVKDVAGYGLKDMLIGSEGTLAVFTRILVRLVPKPVRTRTLLAGFGSLVAAGEAVATILAERIVPCTLEILDAVTIRAVEAFGGLGLPEGLEALLLIEVDGHPAVVEEESHAVGSICRRLGARRVRRATSEEEAEDLRSARRAAFTAPSAPRSDRDPGGCHRAALRRARDVDTDPRHRRSPRSPVRRLRSRRRREPPSTCLTDARDRTAVASAEAAFEEIFAAAIALGGTITGEHGIGLAKRRFLPLQVGEPALRFMRQVKAVLDPNHVLNPGKVFEPGPRCEHPPLGHPRYAETLA